MTALHDGGRRDKLEIAPNLWAGIGLVRRGAGTALVGDPKTVAERLREYQALGIETVIASGYPHLEEAYKVAELLFPELGIGASAALDARHGARRVRRRRLQAGDRRRVTSSVGGRRAPPAAAAEFPADRLVERPHDRSRNRAARRVANAAPRARFDPRLSRAPASAGSFRRCSSSVWQASASLGWLPERYCPRPSPCSRPGWRLTLSGELPRNIGVSFLRALAGLVVGGGDRLRVRPRQRPVAAQRPPDGHHACRWCATFLISR